MKLDDKGLVELSKRFITWDSLSRESLVFLASASSVDGKCRIIYMNEEPI